MVANDAMGSNKSDQLPRQPALRLIGVPGMRFKAISEADAIYPFAAHAWRH
jgi:hypothetical protein